MARKEDTNVFIESVRMETQTVFMNNGVVRTYPCPWELGKHITVEEVARQQGRMVTEHDGTTCFVPYHKGTGSRYRMVYGSRHCTAKQTLNEWVITFRFPVVVRVRKLCSLLRVEVTALCAALQALCGQGPETEAAERLPKTVEDQNKGGMRCR